MKKILLSILFLIVFFCFPRSAFGANLDITVTINSVRIPEASMNMLAPDGPNTEFRLCYGAIVLVNDSTESIVGSSNLSSCLKSGTISTITYSDYSATTKYKVYADIAVNQLFEWNYNIYKADCTPVANNSGWYYFSYYPYYVDSEGSNISFFCERGVDYINFPWPYYYTIDALFAVDPQNVLYIDGSYYGYYWRSPALFTIN